mmetsp:Transcript_40493/g.96569  ORF Transcript_40493/g.96569 Transcript_40493/m.96569 type:complete len:233 (-) Transcript_40493:84-782(-)
MDPGAATTILPPLVRKLENKSSNASTGPDHGGLADDLLRELPSGPRLGFRIFSADLRIKSISSVLSQIHGFVRDSFVLTEHAAEADAPICVDTPNVNLIPKLVNGLIKFADDFSIDRRDGVFRVNTSHNLSNFPDTSNAVAETHAHIQAVVIPFVPDTPHQDGRMILCGSYGLCRRVCRRSTIIVDTVHDPNPFAPERVQYLNVCDRFVGPDSIDSHALHQRRVLLNKASEV